MLDELLCEGMNPEGAVYGVAIICDGHEVYTNWMHSLEEGELPAMARLLGVCAAEVCGSIAAILPRATIRR